MSGQYQKKPENYLNHRSPERFLEFLPYVAHSEAIKFMVKSSLLILVIPLHQSNKSIITGKLFEYLASGKPILCLGPVDGDAAEIINMCKAGRTFTYYDIGDISDFMIKNIRNPGHSDISFVENYSRLNLVRRIAAILELNEKCN